MGSSQIGRNEPCYCGSGKKYKKCCLAKESGEEELSGMDPLWRDLRKVIDGLSVKIVLFAEERFGEALIAEAWSEFLFEDGESPSGPDRFHIPVFFSWFSYHWIPDPYSETYQATSGLAGGTVARAFLKKRQKTLNPLAVRYIEACQNSVFSFYDILSAEPGTGMKLRDILTEEEFDIVDRAASTSVVPGRILFGNVVQIEHLTLMDATAPYMIPVEKKPVILALKSFVRKNCPHPSRKDLVDFDVEIRETYQTIMEELRNPVPPTMLNTDDELVVIHEITYDIDSPRQAFDVLKDLSVAESEEEILRSAVYDDAGALTGASIPWSKLGNKIHSTWENTLLGHLKIDGKTLTITTNSDNRAQTIREIVETRLPGSVRFRSDNVISQKELASMARERGESDSETGASPTGSIPETGQEVREAVKDFLQKEILQWPHKNIPLLGGKKPLEAVETEEGRDMVESLLLDMEQREIHPDMLIDREIMSELRKILGLGDRPFRPGDGQG